MKGREPAWIAGFLCLAILGVVFLIFRGAGDPPGRKSGEVAADPSSAPAPASRTGARGDGADQAAALDGILGDKDPRTRSPRFGKGFREWFEANPEEALAYLRQMPPGSEFTAGLLIALGTIGRGDPERAVRLGAELATRKEDLIVFNALFDLIAREHPERVAGFRSGSPEARRRRDGRIQEWAQKDPEAAFTLAMRPRRDAKGCRGGIGTRRPCGDLAQRSIAWPVVAVRRALSAVARTEGPDRAGPGAASKQILERAGTVNRRRWPWRVLSRRTIRNPPSSGCRNFRMRASRRAA